MNQSDKLIYTQGNASTFARGTDGRLVYNGIDGEDKKYLIEGEGGGSGGQAREVINDYGTVLSSNTDSGKTVSNISIDPQKPTNGNSMNVFFKFNGNNFMSLNNFNNNHLTLTVGEYGSTSNKYATVRLKVNEYVVQTENFAIENTITVKDEVYLSDETGLTSDYLLLTTNLINGIFNREDQSKDTTFEVSDSFTPQDVDNFPQYSKKIDFFNWRLNKGIRLEFYEGSATLGTPQTIGFKISTIGIEQDPYGVDQKVELETLLDAYYDENLGGGSIQLKS